MMGLIRRSYKFLNNKNFIPLYKSLGRIHLDYVVSVWSPSHQYLADEIERVQRRATKLPGMKDFSYEQRIRKLKLPTLAYRRARSDMIKTFKIINGLYYDSEITMDIDLEIDSKPGLRGHIFKLSKQLYRIQKYLFDLVIHKSFLQ